MLEFKYKFKYSQNKTNVVIDVLSCKNVVIPVYITEGLLLAHIKEGLQHDDWV